MNKLFVVFYMVLPVALIGQYDSKGDDEISRFNPGVLWYFNGLSPADDPDLHKYDRLIFDVTYNDWVGDTDLFRNQWSSIGFNLNLMWDIPLNKKNTVGMGVGVAYSRINIHHNMRLDRIDSLDATQLNEKGELDAFNKSTFGANSFSVPVEMRFRFPGWKHFKLHIGGRIGYQPRAFTKYVGKNDQGMRTVQKTIGFHDEQKLLYSIHARLGVRNWALYASYSLNPLFSNKNSTELHRTQVGLSISLF